MVEKVPDIKTSDNLEIHPDKVMISVNPKFYDLDVVYSAMYKFLDSVYIKINGNPEEEVIVEMKPKGKIENLEKLGREFNNELVNYAGIKITGRKTFDVRREIVERALKSHDSDESDKNKN